MNIASIVNDLLIESSEIFTIQIDTSDSSMTMIQFNNLIISYGFTSMKLIRSGSVLAYELTLDTNKQQDKSQNITKLKSDFLSALSANNIRVINIL